MTKKLVAAILIVSLAGCTTAMDSPSPAFSEPVPANYKDLVLAEMKATFFDPYTVRDAQISQPRVGPSWEMGGQDGWVVCLRSNAKNRMGGYTGLSDIVYMINGDKIVSTMNGPAPFYCGDKATFEPFPEASQLK